jgi:hypothetical protein
MQVYLSFAGTIYLFVLTYSDIVLVGVFIYLGVHPP